jgi:hypothetical protein
VHNYSLKVYFLFDFAQAQIVERLKVYWNGGEEPKGVIVSGNSASIGFLSVLSALTFEEKLNNYECTNRSRKCS